MTSRDLTAERAELLAALIERMPGGNLRPHECPKCGWHVSSHSVSMYGLDCPGGVSPANLERRLPGQEDTPVAPTRPLALKSWVRGGGRDAPVIDVCTTCGAAVGDRILHARWHGDGS